MQAHVTLVDHGDALLKAFSEGSGAYAAKVLDEGRRRAPSRHRRRRGRPGPRDALRRQHDQDALRRLGRRAPGGACRPAAGLTQGRGGRIDVAPDLTVDGLPGRLRRRRHRQHPEPGRRARCPQLGLGRPAERRLGGEEHPAPTSTASPREPFHYQRQGDHGDDRPRRGGRRGRRPPRAARHDRVRGLARRPRRADVGVPQPDRRLRRLGAGTTSARTAPDRSIGPTTPSIDWSTTTRPPSRRDRSRQR